MSAGTMSPVGVDQLWQRFLPLVRERLDVLSRCAAAHESRNLTPELREEAAAAAHKLAGSLDSYGRTGGSALAAEVEDVLRSGDDPGARLAQFVDLLRNVVEDT